MEQSPTSKKPSLSYGMPACPSCGKQGLVITDKEHVACILCDYKRDLSQSLKRTRGSAPIKHTFLWLRTQVFQRTKKVYDKAILPQPELNERDFSDPISNDNDALVVDLFLEEQGRNLAGHIAIAVIAIASFLFISTFAEFGLSEGLNIVILILAFPILMIARYALIRYRIKAGYFGNNLNEGRQLIEFVQSFDDAQGPPSGGDDMEVFPEVKTETESQTVTDSGIAGELA
ncbi:hypothetical protein [Leptothoe kymatousa]|uniref:Uncharacterized protein n=1 Tax=Leptothoe kymatousa TAU-MAC 1615 TaxID=2364775 RepID=A0ABS5Y2Y8_9CYAN|nr:hypothetical protein [Leptothoe kymatousa]MBT9312161.1 hypothetical protein [Leptothoe kymatousa TAU-MAC 1615]